MDYLDKTGLAHLTGKLKTQIAGKADANHTHTPASIGAAASGHVADKANPHGVTAAQVGALSTSGGTLYGPLSFSGMFPLTFDSSAYRQWGSINFSGTGISFGMGSDHTGPGKISNVSTPIDALDAANKQYVDEVVAAAITGAIGGSY